MKQNLFTGLENLGFTNTNNINLFENKNESKNLTKNNDTKNIPDIKSLLYDRKVVCPVCGCSFTQIAVKSSAYKMLKRDSDFFIHYEVVNPYFYDVWICNSCGYTAMKSDYNKLRKFQYKLVKENISSKWKGKSYPEIYDLNIAIERYKLALINYYYVESKASQKAMNCLKLAWMYRLSENYDKEKVFISNALKGFNEAYYNENFPIYGMDKYTSMYLIGELNRRIGNLDEAMKWLSNVITTPSVNKRLKELARDQKDLIKESKTQSHSSPTENFKVNENQSIFSRFFKK